MSFHPRQFLAAALPAWGGANGGPGSVSRPTTLAGARFLSAPVPTGRHLDARTAADDRSATTHTNALTALARVHERVRAHLAQSTPVLATTAGATPAPPLEAA